jgi:hypothetical protein
MNGTYKHDGEENGKPKWAKNGMKIFWTGGSWDCFYGGYSPEAPANTPVPPLHGYDKDKGSTEIQVHYRRVGSVEEKKNEPKVEISEKEIEAKRKELTEEYQHLLKLIEDPLVYAESESRLTTIGKALSSEEELLK